MSPELIAILEEAAKYRDWWGCPCSHSSDG